MILRTLANEELVAFEDGEKTYSLGSGLVMRARRALDPESVFSIARPELRRLARCQNVTAALWREAEDDRIALLGFESSEQDMRLHMTIGQRLPLLAGAAGRTIASTSSLSQSRLEALFNRVRWEDAPSFAKYIRDLDAVRQQGRAADTGQFRRGVTTVAAANGSESGGIFRLIVSASLLGVHHSAVDVERLGAAVEAAVRRITQLRGG